jgi:uncharacterized protein YndB with AHSA1/START domain
MSHYIEKRNLYAAGNNKGLPPVDQDMNELTLNRNIDAPRTAVWNVLADFPNIASWNSGVKKSHATGAETGLGAQRHCDLSPAGGVEETVRAWEPESKMAVSIDSAKGLPLKSGLATFDLADDGDATAITMEYTYETKWGVLGKLMKPVLHKRFQKGFNGFIDDLETAAKSAD